MSNNQANFSEKVTIGGDFNPGNGDRDEDEKTIEPLVMFDYSIRSGSNQR